MTDPNLPEHRPVEKRSHLPVAPEGEPIIGPFDGLDLLAIDVSLIIPGVGHALLGQTTKAIGYFVFAATAIVALFCGCLPMFIPLMLLPPLAIVDTIMVAKTRKLRPVGDMEFFPQ